MLQVRALDAYHAPRPRRWNETTSLHCRRRDRAVMTLALLLEQLFNGVQFGLMLFLMAVGVTLVFGIMRVINLAHGSLFMLGGYFLMAALSLDAVLCAGGALALIGGGVGRDRARDCGPAAALPPRPARPGAGDVRAHLVLQRGGDRDLGPRADPAERFRRSSRARSRSFPAPPIRSTGWSSPASRSSPGCCSICSSRARASAR